MKKRDDNKDVDLPVATRGSEKVNTKIENFKKFQKGRYDIMGGRFEFFILTQCP
jgi:hypothetical protein